MGILIMHQRQPGFASVSLHFQGSGEEGVTVLSEAAAQLSVLPRLTFKMMDRDCSGPDSALPVHTVSGHVMSCG